MRVVKFYVYFHRFHPDTLSISGVLNSIDDCLPSINDNKKCFSFFLLRPLDKYCVQKGVEANYSFY